MKINLKARLHNKTFVISAAALVVAFIYQALSLFDVVPRVSEDSVMTLVSMTVNVLAALGVLVDPTTPGASDSDRAMTYYTEYDERDEEVEVNE